MSETSESSSKFPPSKAIAVGELLKPETGTRSFEVPKYQRNYQWDGQHVKWLLQEIKGGFEKQGQSETVPLDTLHTAAEIKGSHRHLIVDGQQRLTTISIILVCFYDIFKADQYQDKQELRPYIWPNFHQESPGSTNPVLVQRGTSELASQDERKYQKVAEGVLDRNNAQSPLLPQEVTVSNIVNEIYQPKRGTSLTLEETNFLEAYRWILDHLREKQRIPFCKYLIADCYFHWCQHQSPSEGARIFRLVNKFPPMPFPPNVQVRTFAETSVFGGHYTKRRDLCREAFDKLESVETRYSLSEGEYNFLCKEVFYQMVMVHARNNEETRYLLHSQRADAAYNFMIMLEGLDKNPSTWKEKMKDLKLVIPLILLFYYPEKAMDNQENLKEDLFGSQTKESNSSDWSKENLEGPEKKAITKLVHVFDRAKLLILWDESSRTFFTPTENPRRWLLSLWIPLLIECCLKVCKSDNESRGPEGKRLKKPSDKLDLLHKLSLAAVLRCVVHFLQPRLAKTTEEEILLRNKQPLPEIDQILRFLAPSKEELGVLFENKGSDSSTSDNAGESVLSGGLPSYPTDDQKAVGLRRAILRYFLGIASNKEEIRRLYSKKKKREFECLDPDSTKSLSVDHIYPQTPKNGQEQWKHKKLHAFGNLMLVTKDFNEIAGNLSLQEKAEKFKDEKAKDMTLMEHPLFYRTSDILKPNPRNGEGNWTPDSAKKQQDTDLGTIQYYFSVVTGDESVEKEKCNPDGQKQTKKETEGSSSTKYDEWVTRCKNHFKECKKGFDEDVRELLLLHKMRDYGKDHECPTSLPDDVHHILEEPIHCESESFVASRFWDYCARNIEESGAKKANGTSGTKKRKSSAISVEDRCPNCSEENGRHDIACPRYSFFVE